MRSRATIIRTFSLMAAVLGQGHRPAQDRGDPADFPYGRGPQGDVIRINNLVRLVRGGLK